MANRPDCLVTLSKINGIYVEINEDCEEMYLNEGLVKEECL
jgi:hypothetical protein